MTETGVVLEAAWAGWSDPDIPSSQNLPATVARSIGSGPEEET